MNNFLPSFLLSYEIKFAESNVEISRTTAIISILTQS